jgi:prevent-host-death family protein
MRTKQTQVNMHEAKTRLSALVQRSTRGEKIIIAKDGVPLVRLVPIKKNKTAKRVFGQLKGKITMRADFKKPLSEAELREMFGDALT